MTTDSGEQRGRKREGKAGDVFCYLQGRPPGGTEPDFSFGFIFSFSGLV